MLQTGGELVQAKLMVGPPGDRFEQEADRVADAVMDGQSVQRMCAECEEESSVQRAPIADGQGVADEELEMDGQDRQDSPVVRRSADGAGHAPVSLSEQIAATLGRGHQLPETTRRELGGRMGTDFSDVRVHTDSGAADMCRDLGAHAFTVGRDIYFNHGRYDPQSASGTHLLAHELTHRSARPASDGDGKSGHQASLGTVKFFGKDTTGDLGKEDVLSSDSAIAADWKPGTRGGVAKSGWLPSTRTQPSWWGKSLDGPKSRWANSWWNCCDKDVSKHWSKSDALPK